MLLQQPSQPLKVYEPAVEALSSTESTFQHQQGRVWAATDGLDRKACLQAMEDKENVDPATGLTVATRRQRRRLVLVQVQVSSPLDAVSKGADAAKSSRPPLKDITSAFPEAVVCSSQP